LKRMLSSLFAVLLAQLATGQSLGVREAALARVKLIQRIAADPEMLKAVRAKNASGETMDEVQRKDREWAQNPQFPLRKALTSGACAERLRDLTKGDANVAEVILMDKNGANVCVSRETSDYWQGDEAKFQKTFGADKALFVDEPAFDQSTNVFAIQMSAIVYDGGAKVGALTLGLRINQRELGGKR
jgi:hypothetical protein